MKNIIFFLTLTLILSCGPESNEEFVYNYSIINNSGKTVTISLYKDDIRDTNSTVNIAPGQKLQKQNVQFYPAPGYSMKALLIAPSNISGVITHVEILFDNQRRILYKDCNFNYGNCLGEPRNIFNVVYNDDLTEVYTITPEDFQNAIDCGGNCY